MSHSGLDRTEEEILIDQVSDDALEAAATTDRENAKYTLPASLICIPFAE
jgi:hypothetical protein